MQGKAPRHLPLVVSDFLINVGGFQRHVVAEQELAVGIDNTAPSPVRNSPWPAPCAKNCTCGAVWPWFGSKISGKRTREVCDGTAAIWFAAGARNVGRELLTGAWGRAGLEPSPTAITPKANNSTNADGTTAPRQADPDPR